MKIIFLGVGEAIDHSFGLAPILMVMRGRKKPLTIICRQGDKKPLQDLINIGLKGIKKFIDFKIIFIEVNPSKQIKHNEFNLSFAKTIHHAPNLAIKVEFNNKE